MTDDVPKVVKSLEPDACLGMARNVRPIMSELAMQKYAREFDGRSVLPERTSEHESTSPPHDFDGESRTGSERETASEAPDAFDGPPGPSRQDGPTESVLPECFDGDAVADQDRRHEFAETTS